MIYAIVILLIMIFAFVLKICLILESIERTMNLEEVKLPALLKGAAVFKRKRKGAIFIPPSDEDLARESIIKRNREAGRDTPISELTEEENV